MIDKNDWQAPPGRKEYTITDADGDTFSFVQVKGQTNEAQAASVHVNDDVAFLTLHELEELAKVVEHALRFARAFRN